MNQTKILLVTIIFFCCGMATAQQNPFTGVWQMETTGTSPVCMQLKIGAADKNMLYPACISLQSGSFYAEYQLLLVKKNAWQLAISKNKFAAKEKPFALNLFYLNGSFNLVRNDKGRQFLNINRLPFSQANKKTDTTGNNKLPLQQVLQHIINTADLQFTRISATPWRDAYTDKILSPSISPVYFGLVDTMYLPTRYGTMRLASTAKGDKATVVLNNKPQLEELLLTKKERNEDIMVDTGTSILAFFGDYEYNSPPSRGQMQLEFGIKKMMLSFANSADSAAAFIAARVHVMQDSSKTNVFAPYTYPGPGEPPLRSNEKLIASIKSVSKQLTLAVWDDAVEDGDTISININGTWVVKNMLLKNRPQFITVSLNAGANTITFTGENLGSIPPNTSVLEIIDGKKRKAFFMETVPMEHNLLKIYYDN
jgi:hypothetical protein